MNKIIKAAIATIVCAVILILTGIVMAIIINYWGEKTFMILCCVVLLISIFILFYKYYSEFPSK